APRSWHYCWQSVRPGRVTHPGNRVWSPNPRRSSPWTTRTVRIAWWRRTAANGSCEDDRVLCWRQVHCAGYTNDGGIPLRFFLKKPYRILNDGWGVFVYDPDAGYARGFRPEGMFKFHGWRNGVMVMKGSDGTLYSCLTGKAFQGPKFGHRLEPRATLVTDWGFWHKRYPQALAYTMFDKYRPVELPPEVNED